MICEIPELEHIIDEEEFLSLEKDTCLESDYRYELTDCSTFEHSASKDIHFIN